MKLTLQEAVLNRVFVVFLMYWDPESGPDYLLVSEVGLLRLVVSAVLAARTRSSSIFTTLRS